MMLRSLAWALVILFNSVGAAAPMRSQLDGAGQSALPITSPAGDRIGLGAGTGRLGAGSGEPTGAASDSGPLPSDQLSREGAAQYARLALDFERQYLRIDTTNPPGNEVAAARWFKSIFDREGISSEVFEYAPGRANILARLPASAAANARPIILLSHMDVVTSDPAHWKLPPFAAQEAGGYIYGRGAQDMKSDAIAQLVTMIVLKREHAVLSRDVLLLATADEEVDDSGSEWMLAHQKDKLGNAEYLITEGGENLEENGKATYVGVDTAEKSPYWLHIVARGRPGHGSRPIADSAPDELVRALNKLVAYPTELKVLPVTQEFMTAMAPLETGEHARCFRNAREAIRDAACREFIVNDESLNYLFRNTISLTMLNGSKQTNVIPGEAWANVDVRLLPGEEPRDFLALMRKVVGVPGVTVEPLNQRFRPANASPTDTPLFAALKRVSARYFPGAPVAPRMTSGYTENQMYRQLGITCYGFSPYMSTAEVGATEHGDNERISVAQVERGWRVLYDVVMQVAEKK